MKLGFVTAILPELTFDNVLNFARHESFFTVEVMCWPVGKAERKYAGVTHIDVTSITKTKAQEILGHCQDQGVSISALGYYPNMLDPDPAVSRAGVSHFKKVIAAAPKLGVNLVTGFVGRDWTKTVDENWPRFLKIWQPIIQYAEDHGVKIGIENCPMSFTRDEWPAGKNLMTTPAIWRRAFNDIDSPSFGLNYDPSHFILQDMDPLSPLAEFKSKLFHVHAKDVKINRAALNEVGRFDFPFNGTSPASPATAMSTGPPSWPNSCASATPAPSASKSKTTPSAKPSKAACKPSKSPATSSPPSLADTYSLKSLCA